MSGTLLENLLSNRAKTNLVAFFLANPPRAFFVGELQKRLGSRNLGPHLNSLLKAEMLKTFTKKGRRYYILNKKNYWWDKLKPALNKIKKYEDELIVALNKIPNLKVAVLSGLFVANPHLSCDILLVGKLPENSLLNFVKGAEKMIGQELNYAVFSVEEYQSRKGIFDRFMKDVFDNPHLIIVDKLRS